MSELLFDYLQGVQKGKWAHISESVQNFCSAQGIDSRRFMLTGLCTEELLMIIVTQGFSRDCRKHCCQVRVAICGDLVILRLRDDFL